MTVVFDAGQNSTANFDHLRRSGLHYVGSVPPKRLPRPARPARIRRTPWTQPGSPVSPRSTPAASYTARAGGSCSPTRRTCTRTSPILTDTTLAKVGRQLDDLAATLARGKNPPHPRTSSHTEDREDHPQSLGERRHRLGTDRREPGRPPADLDDRHHETTSVGREHLRQTQS